MNSDLRKSFVTYYVESLYERTRQEKTGAKWGLDWLVYNLGLELFGKPVRLPFVRTADGEYSKSKSEAEFGIDLAFLNEKQELTIFVLKDEPLTNRSWTDAGFSRDLDMAQKPDLNGEGLSSVSKVTVILVYNKDDEQNGVKAYENFVSNANPLLRGRIPLEFRRWNLSELVERTLAHLLTPALVPQKFFGQLGYLCAQAADFAHGSDPWMNQLVPGWKRFLHDVLNEGAGERGLGLVPVALIIVSQQAQKNPSIQTGVIDLTEWAAIALWRTVPGSKDQKHHVAVLRFWIEFYVAELERFYTEQIPHLTTKHAIDQFATGGSVGTIAAAYVGYWHFGRLGLLALAFTEIARSDTEEDRQVLKQTLHRISNWLVELLNANACLLRPILDIQHIEIYLAAMAWRLAGRTSVIGDFFSALVPRLFLRRLGQSDLPFLDGANSLQNVFEQVATKEKLVLSDSSFLVLMLLELSCLLEPSKRDALLQQIHADIVLGKFPTGEAGNHPPLDLISWVAPADWQEKVLQGYVDDGEAVSLQPFAETRDADAADLYAGLTNLVGQMQKVSKLQFKHQLPLAALVLASMKHQSPLPPELWRGVAFTSLHAPKRAGSSV